MNRQALGKMCRMIALVLAALFSAKTLTDYIRYSATLNSAPFWVFVLVNAVYFLAPAAVALALGLWLGRKERE